MAQVARFWAMAQEEVEEEGSMMEAFGATVMEWWAKVDTGKGRREERWDLSDRWLDRMGGGGQQCGGVRWWRKDGGGWEAKRGRWGLTPVELSSGSRRPHTSDGMDGGWQHGVLVMGGKMRGIDGDWQHPGWRKMKAGWLASIWTFSGDGFWWVGLPKKMIEGEGSHDRGRRSVVQWLVERQAYGVEMVADGGSREKIEGEGGGNGEVGFSGRFLALMGSREGIEQRDKKE